MWRHGLENIPEPYRNLMSKLLEELKRKFKDKLISLVVYGSVARGNFRKDSDIDILLVIEELPRSRLKRQDLFMEVENKLGKVIEELKAKGYLIDFSPIIKTPDEAKTITPLYLDMVDDAIIIYDKDNFFENVLKKLAKELKKLGAKKVKIGKKWYWKLKSDYKFGEVISIE